MLVLPPVFLHGATPTGLDVVDSVRKFSDHEKLDDIKIDPPAFRKHELSGKYYSPLSSINNGDIIDYETHLITAQIVY